jgi:formate dehydrogenase major subunit
VRACREVQVNDVIGYAFRGSDAKIVFDLDDPMGESTCVGCGECVQACPTGALLPSLPAIVAGDMLQRARTARGRPRPACARGDARHAASERRGARPARPARPAERRAAPAAGWAQAENDVASLCPYCGVGCQTTYHVADDRILRVSGRDGPSNHGGCA